MSSKEEEIFTACENGTYKFALTQAHKLIKKYPKSTYYQVLHNYVLLQSGKEHDAIASCKEIFSKTPNDAKSLELLNTIFNEVGMKNEALQVYENAAKKYPSFDVLTKWFHLGCETVNFRVLQKSSMALKNMFNKRMFNLWAAFTCYLAANATDASVMEKGLFPKLGLKIAESLKPMQTEQETYVLVKLLQMNGQTDQMVEEILVFGKEDKLDLELQILLLQSLDKLERWEELYKWSETILLSYKLDDFDTWKYLIKSSLRLNKDITEIISSYDTRNSKLANVELQLQSGKDIHEAVFAYLIAMGCKNCAFFDIKHYINYVDSAKLLDWFDDQEIPKGEKGLTWEVNVTKFKILLDTSLLQEPEFIAEMVSKYDFYKSLLINKSRTDFSTSSEIILLIVQALLTQSFTTESIIICVVILEGAVSRDEHEFHLRLWLIQLYTLLNCPQRAEFHYKVLSVKNIQHDILSHYLCSRLSSTHPVVALLEKSYEVYRSNDVETVYFAKIGFNKGAYNKLEKIFELQTKLDNSFEKRHLALQALKVGRLLNDKALSLDYKKFALSDVVESDNRDLNVFWNFGIDEALGKIEKALLVNIPAAGYNEVIAVQERLIAGEIDQAPELDLSVLSDPEKWSFNVIVGVKDFLSGKSHLAAVTDLYDNVPKIPQEPSWATAHAIYTIIDTCKAVQSIWSSQKSKVKGSSEVKERNITLLSKLRDDTIMNTKASAASAVLKYRAAAETSETVKKLGFVNIVDHCVDFIIKGNTDSFKLMSLL